MRARIPILLVVAAFATVCSHAQGGSTGESGVNYSAPIPNGVAVATATDAAAAISAFQIYDPKGLTGQETIYVTPSGTPANAQVVAFVFQTSGYSLVDVVEGVPEQSTTAEYNAANEALVAQDGQPYPHGSITTVAIRSGAEGFLSRSEDGKLNTVFWMENGIEFVVEGPILTSAQATQIANSI
jgi:hypothetical protein